MDRRSYCIAATLLVLAACSSEVGGGPGQKKNKQAVPVTVATVEQRDVPVQIHAIGTVEPYSTVSLKSQVEGQLAQVHFQEGQRVKKGDRLFTIDPRPFEASLRQAEGNLARDEASAENAAVNERRMAALVKQQLVAQSDYDQAHAQAAALRASVDADRAAVRYAKLQLQFCYIDSPIDGRIGQILVHGGNVVKANDIPMAVINQIRPTYVSFAVPEQHLPEIRARAASGQLTVHAFVGQDTQDPVTGTLSFINNSVDAASGTVLLKGLFGNENEALWPGQFVDVALTLSVRRNAVVVPKQAVEVGQQGSYVYVVGTDMTVALQPVVTGETAGTDMVITQGLSPGQRVVTEGQVRLAPGFTVQIKDGTDQPEAPAAAAGT